MGKKRLVQAVATLVGCTVGAGILGIPYVVQKAGFLTGLFDIIALGIITLFINLYLGEVTLRTEGKHQLTYYADKYIGKMGKKVMFASMLIGIYGALIAYLIGSGVALSSILGASPILWSTLFFLGLGLLIYIGIDAIAQSESMALPVVITLIAVIFGIAIAKVSPANIIQFDIGSIFVPYGLILFAFIGTSAIPEMREELENEKQSLKKAIVIGTLIPIVLYVIFTFAIVGALGPEVNEVGSVGISKIVGERFAFLGGVLALFTLTTSFLALGLALNEMFRYDYDLGKNTAWLLSSVAPFALFLLLSFLRIASFTYVIEVTGVITGVTTGILVFIMAIKAKKQGQRQPEYSLKLNWLIASIFVVLLLLGGFFMLVGL